MGVNASVQKYLTDDPAVGAMVEQYCLTKYNVNTLYKTFSRGDKDKSGYIDVSEFSTLFREEKSEYLTHLFRYLDIDQDHRINFAEFINLVSIFCLYTESEIVKFMFDMYDVDRSGSIQDAELKAVLVKLDKSQAFPTAARRALRLFDLDSDGRINLAEFTEMNLRYPHLLWPAFRLQYRIQEATLGLSTWRRVGVRIREKMRGARYGPRPCCSLCICLPRPRIRKKKGSGGGDEKSGAASSERGEATSKSAKTGASGADGEGAPNTTTTSTDGASSAAGEEHPFAPTSTAATNGTHAHTTAHRRHNTHTSPDAGKRKLRTKASAAAATDGYTPTNNNEADAAAASASSPNGAPRKRHPRSASSNATASSATNTPTSHARTKSHAAAEDIISPLAKPTNDSRSRHMNHGGSSRHASQMSHDIRSNGLPAIPSQSDLNVSPQNASDNVILSSISSTSHTGAPATATTTLAGSSIDSAAAAAATAAHGNGRAFVFGDSALASTSTTSTPSNRRASDVTHARLASPNRTSTAKSGALARTSSMASPKSLQSSPSTASERKKKKKKSARAVEGGGAADPSSGDDANGGEGVERGSSANGGRQRRGGAADANGDLPNVIREEDEAERAGTPARHNGHARRGSDEAL